MPDFANASSVQGLGQMVAEWAASVETRITGNPSPTVEEPAPEEVPA